MAIKSFDLDGFVIFWARKLPLWYLCFRTLCKYVRCSVLQHWSSPGIACKRRKMCNSLLIALNWCKWYPLITFPLITFAECNADDICIGFVMLIWMLVSTETDTNVMKSKRQLNWWLAGWSRCTKVEIKFRTSELCECKAHSLCAQNTRCAS